MDTALGTVEGFLHVMSFFLIMAQRLCTSLHAALVAEIYFTLNENTSTHIPVVCLNIDHRVNQS